MPSLDNNPPNDTADGADEVYILDLGDFEQVDTNDGTVKLTAGRRSLTYDGQTFSFADGNTVVSLVPPEGPTEDIEVGDAGAKFVPRIYWEFETRTNGTVEGYRRSVLEGSDMKEADKFLWEHIATLEILRDECLEELRAEGTQQST